MIDALDAAGRAAGAGLRAQSERMRVIAQNLANAATTGDRPGASPYVRQTVTFAAAVDRASGAVLVRTQAVGRDPSPFPLEHRPDHPAADARGMVRLPNVNPIVEVADMQDANRAYQANVQVIRQTRQLHTLLIDLLKG